MTKILTDSRVKGTVLAGRSTIEDVLTILRDAINAHTRSVRSFMAQKALSIFT